MAPELSWLLSLREKEFGHIFSTSPVRRTKWRGLIRNACIAAGNLAGHYAPYAPARLQPRNSFKEIAASPDSFFPPHAACAGAHLIFNKRNFVSQGGESYYC